MTLLRTIAVLSRCDPVDASAFGHRASYGSFERHAQTPRRVIVAGSRDGGTFGMFTIALGRASQ